MATLKGRRELQQRLKAIKQAFKPIGRNWADDTVQLAKSRVKVRTGRTKNSIRRKNASMRKASVEVRGGGRFLEAGTKAHPIRARRFQAMPIGGGSTGLPRFAKRVSHPGSRKQPFLKPSARDALARNPMAEELIKLWNRAA